MFVNRPSNKVPINKREATRGRTPTQNQHSLHLYTLQLEDAHSSIIHTGYMHVCQIHVCMYTCIYTSILIFRYFWKMKEKACMHECIIIEVL